MNEDMKTHLMVAICVTVIMIIAYTQYNSRYGDNSSLYVFMNGYWKASQKYCMDSGIKSAALWINKENNSMYMFMEKEDFIMINQVVPFQLSSASGSLTSKEYKITFEEEVSPIPKSCNMRVGLGDGMLSLYDGDTIYLTVYKDSMATSNTV